MASTLTGGNITVTLTGTITAPIANGGVNQSLSLPAPSAGTVAQAGKYTKSIATGTGNGQANALASLSGTITAGTPVDIDLTAIPQGGQTLTLTAVKSILVQEVSTTPTQANTLLVGDSSGTLTNAITAFWSLATGREVIGSQGAWVRDDYYGFTVDSSHKVLRLNAGAGTAIYQIDIAGKQ